MEGIVGAEADRIEVHDAPSSLPLLASPLPNPLLFRRSRREEYRFLAFISVKKVKTPTRESSRKFNDTVSQAIENRYTFSSHCWNAWKARSFVSKITLGQPFSDLHCSSCFRERWKNFRVKRDFIPRIEERD